MKHVNIMVDVVLRTIAALALRAFAAKSLK
jgi:hypothetical protein